MKTEGIKTWRDRITTPTTNQKNLFMSMQDEIDDLRAALKERDAEIISLHSQWEQSRNETDASHTHLATQCAVMQQALSDAEIDALTVAQWGEQIGAMLAAYRAYARAIESKIGAKP